MFQEKVYIFLLCVSAYCVAEIIKNEIIVPNSYSPKVFHAENKGSELTDRNFSYM